MEADTGVSTMTEDRTQQVPDREYLCMKQLPDSEKPYEKCLKYGAEYLSDAELLAVILRSGTKGERAVELAIRLLSTPENSGLTGLFHMSVQQLKGIRGIGTVKAIQLKCVAEIACRISHERVSDGVHFSDPQSVSQYYAQYFMEDCRHAEQEKVILAMLDSKGRRLGEQVISMGTVNASLISPREVFITALKYRAVSVILMHNHPSGNPQPSRDDCLLTDRMAHCGKMLGIELLDHIIIGDQKVFSFREEGLLN